MQGDPVETPWTDGPPRVFQIAALALAVAAVGTVLAVALSRRSPPQPVVIAAVPAPAEGTPECRALLSALPDRLGDLQRAPAAQPAPAGAAAWRDGADPVIMRCGLTRPAEFVVGSPIQVVDEVQWFRLADPDARRSTWIAVDRPVYIALTLPDGSGPTAIQILSAAIAANMAAVPIRPGPPP